MLKLIKLNSKSQIWDYFKKIDMDRDAWIVSKASERDLMSAHILNDKGYFLDMSVQLNRSFFQSIHKSVFPEHTIVSREFAEAYLKRKMAILQDELSIDVIDEKSRLRSMTYFASLLLDPDLDEGKLQEWLDVSEERKLRLKPDLLLNELFLSFFLDNKMVCEDWVLAHLQNADLSNVAFPISRFYFDLGPDYSVVESSILIKLAKNFEINLFQVVHSFDSEYTHLLQSYERFDVLDNLAKANASSGEPTVELKKFSSAISESRFAVGQIKKWHDSSVPYDQMAIIAPDIQKYVDVLSWQLLAEGVPTNQNKKSTFLEFQDIRELLSDLSFFKTEIEFSSIRESLARFQPNERLWEEKLNSPFLQSDQLLKMIEKQLPRFFSKHMGCSVESVIQLRSKEMNVAEFLKLTQAYWERGGLSERKEKIINSIYGVTSLVIELNLEEWVEQVERTAMQATVSVGSRDSAGLQLVSLSQLSVFNLKNIVVLGLDENGFRSHFKESIPPDDIFNLGSELGVFLAHPDLSVSSFLLDDLMSQASGTVILSYPSRAIDSAIQNPAAQWQNRAFEQKLIEKEIDTPIPIVWDSLIANNESRWLQQTQQDYKLNSVQWDRDPASAPPLRDFSMSDISLSPSSMQAFLDCRQKFFFQRVLRLKSVDSESFDVNAREKGSWYHSVFEKIITQEHEYISPLLSLGFNDVEREALLHRLQKDFADLTPEGFSPQTWLLVKKSFFENVLKFIGHELSLRRQFPEVKSLKVEWEWNVFYDWETHKFVKDQGITTIKISGVVDRILHNQKTNQLWLIDYKSSLKNYSSHGDWIKKQEFQLLLYNHIVQYQTAETWSAPVENLSYWHLPNLERKKGFVLSDPRYVGFGYSKKDLGTLDDKLKIENEFLEQFKVLIDQMKEGHFYPHPKDEKNCIYCEWRLACRAPHL